ncbi:hypothetical protein SOVF_074920 [Spinacia oleracea]|nr:hypothetical protein SOVF_074920 [Spinacia oleracea]
MRSCGEEIRAIQRRRRTQRAIYEGYFIYRDIESNCATLHSLYQANTINELAIF